MKGLTEAGRAWKLGLLALIFGAGILVGLIAWDHLVLPFHNPWGITGPVTRMRFNPLNNQLRFAVLVGLPALLLLLFATLPNKLGFRRLFADEPPEAAPRLSASGERRTRRIAAAALVLFAVINALAVPTYHASGKFDPFHEGETLGAAESYAAGKLPYKDFVFVHGLHQDPLRSVLAFRLFGRSIGAVRSLESLTKVALFAALAGFLLLAYGRDVVFALATLGLLGFLSVSALIHQPQSIVLMPADVTVYAFLILLGFWQRHIDRGDPGRGRLLWLVSGTTCLAAAALGYSVDRGLYLLVALAILVPCLYFLGLFGVKRRGAVLLAAGAGGLAGIGLLGIPLHFQYREFIRFAFLTLPRYKDLMDGYVFPIRSLPYLLLCILAALNLYRLTFQLLRQVRAEGGRVRGLRAFFGRHLLEIGLLILSLLFFRNALNRSDWIHLAYSAPLTIILFIMTIFRSPLPSLLARFHVRRAFAGLVVIFGVGWCVWCAHRLVRDRLLAENFPVKVPDRAFIPGPYQSAITFLKDNLGPGEDFLTLTNEASWYYFLERPCPCRFPVVWFAMPPFYQQEIIEDLKTKNVKYVLFRNDFWSNAIDRIPNEARLPALFDDIRRHFRFDRNLDGNEIWIRQ